MIVCLLLFFHCGARAQQSGVGDSIDLTKAFYILSKNRIVYNQYNDSIFIIKDHDQWVNFFRRRALKNHQIFASNKQVIKEVTDYFHQPHDKISPQAYVRLKECLADYFIEGNSDSFITLELCKLLQDYAKDAPDSLRFSMVNIWEAVSHSCIYDLSGDSLEIKKSYECLKRNLSDDVKGCPDYARGRFYALWNLSKTSFVPYRIQSLEENRWAYQEMLKMMDSLDVSKLVTPREWKSLKRDVAQYEEKLARNVYMVDSTLMDKQTGDSLLRLAVLKTQDAQKLSLHNFQRNLLLKHRLGEITSDEALVQLWRRYREEKKKLKGKKLIDSDLTLFMTPIFTLLYFNDNSTGTFVAKRKMVLKLCRDAEWGFQNRRDGQGRVGYVKLLNRLTTYPRLIKYLTEKERVRFLGALNVATQVTTYAHSVHVSMIAEVLMKGILKYQPQLLTGTLGHPTLSGVRVHEKQYLDFIHKAAMYHDLGKNSIISVVNNDYRPLTDEEFAIIKKHPALGLTYLKLGPSLAKFHDTTLGHHKWYNGKGGYPEDFDNTKSPMRVMIDIVTLSDCMQAATERVGRNYKGDKTFDAVMEEFRRDAGVKYNPDLVKLIDDHSDLAGKLADLIEDGWVEIYYQIYSRFIR